MQISHRYLCSLYPSWQFDNIYSYISYILGTIVHSEGDQLEMFKGGTQIIRCAFKYHTDIYVLYIIAGNLTPFIHTFYTFWALLFTQKVTNWKCSQVTFKIYGLRAHITQISMDLCSLYHSWQFDTNYSYIFYVFGTVVHSEGDQLEMFKGDTQNLWSARKYHTYIYVLYVIAGNLTPFIHTFFLRFWHYCSLRR